MVLGFKLGASCLHSALTQPPSPELLRKIVLQGLHEIGHIKVFSTSTQQNQENNKSLLKSKTKCLLKQSVIHPLVLKMFSNLIREACAWYLTSAAMKAKVCMPWV